MRKPPHKVACEAADASRNELATKADLYRALYKFAVGITIANADIAIAVVFALSKVLAAE